MQVVQTAGEPPNQGSTALLITGWTWKARNAPSKVAAIKGRTSGRALNNRIGFFPPRQAMRGKASDRLPSGQAYVSISWRLTSSAAAVGPESDRWQGHRHNPHEPSPAASAGPFPPRSLPLRELPSPAPRSDRLGRPGSDPKC